MVHNKKEYLNCCYSILKERKTELQQELEKVQVSFNMETKSSAGDKYETSREMISQEKNKIYARLQEIEKQEQALSLINSENKTQKIGLGTIVQTEKENYFISISLGKLRAKTNEFMAISPASPLAQALLGKQAGDSIVFLGKTHQIISVQ
jgi:transcription elongation GreA/GreB family factor